MFTICLSALNIMSPSSILNTCLQLANLLANQVIVAHISMLLSEMLTFCC